MNHRKFRLVLECVLLAAELARLAIVLLNMAINYSPLSESEVVI